MIFNQCVLNNFSLSVVVFLQLCDGAAAVKVGILLPADTDGVVISPGGRGVDYTPENEESKSFFFDGVATVDHAQSLFSELLRPLAESVSRGFKGALLLCGASNIHNLTDACVVKQVLADVFRCVLPQVRDGCFTSVSFLQFYPDGGAVDLLSPHREALKHVTHPVLGSLVEGLSEVCVSSAEEAFALYETCRETLKANMGSIYSCCSSMFGVSVEWKSHPEEVDSEVFRSRLQLFSLAGAASRADLRGVNPLVKVVDQSQHEAKHLLHLLINEALEGNCRTVIIFCIHPPALCPSDETGSALALAQKVRGFITKATAAVWSPRATEEDIRDKITQLRTEMMSQGGEEMYSIHRLAELTQTLQMVKKQSWEKRREKSMKIKENAQIPGRDGGDHGSAETFERLQDHLKREMEEHIREGRGSAESVHGRVRRIQQLREALREVRVKMEAAAEQTDICQRSQQEYSKVLEQRRKLREDSRRLIQEEVEKMEKDLAQEQTEGPHGELLVLSRERRVLVLQMEALQAEAQQAERHLQNQHLRHQTELQCLRDESLQVFRVFRQVSEEQRKASEDRYRNVLMEAVQDAVFLSAQNQQLQADNKRLRKALAEMKDSITARGDTKHSSQHGPA
uniref:Uncharacterized LOC105417364 n=1 Tax=Takifugu rubripes TaxID=31033 RepID=A0A674N8F4_TAKRU